MIDSRRAIQPTFRVPPRVAAVRNLFHRGVSGAARKPLPPGRTTPPPPRTHSIAATHARTPNASPSLPATHGRRDRPTGSWLRIRRPCRRSGGPVPRRPDHGPEVRSTARAPPPAGAPRDTSARHSDCALPVRDIHPARRHRPWRFANDRTALPRHGWRHASQAWQA